MTDRLMSGEAWRDFCSRLADAGDAILRPECPASPADRAEGYRYLLGFLTSNLVHRLYDPGPEHPAFTRSMDDVMKFGLDAPDGYNYYIASIRDDLGYRLFGKASPATYIGFQFMGERGTLANISLGQHDVAPDGSFEIIVSREPQEGNWFRMPEGARSIMQRQFHLDWENEHFCEIHIETLEPQPGFGNLVDLPSPESVEAMLDGLGGNFHRMTNFWIDFVHGFRVGGDNVAPPAILNPAIGGNKEQLASNGYFKVKPGEALVIEFEPPNALYWSVCLGNFWFMTVDLHHHQSSLNALQAHIDPDGACRMVICHGDPAIANWLDPFGHDEGTMTFRWLEADSSPEISTRLVRESELEDILPAFTKGVSAQQRAEAIAQRKREIYHRFSTPPTSRWFAPIS